MTPDELAALHRACFTTPRPWSAAEFSDLLAGHGAFLTAAPGGFALGRVIAEEAELLTLAVDPAQRRRGVGRGLLADYEAEARARGAAESFLEVAADNAAALGLYHAAGYARAGRRAGYYRSAQGGSLDALVLRRLL